MTQQRLSFSVAGADGTVNIEIETLGGGSLDVHEVDSRGKAMHPSKVLHGWDNARNEVAELMATAIREGRV